MDGDEILRTLGSLATLGDEISEALSLYWSSAEKILRNSDVQLHSPSPEYFAIESNLFSTLFLYSYLQAGMTRSRRVFYAAVNQCLRGMVTTSSMMSTSKPWTPTLARGRHTVSLRARYHGVRPGAVRSVNRQPSAW